MTTEAPLFDDLASISNEAGTITLRLSHELISLLSDQLYQSPAKALEELVVNSFDADALECRIYIPDLGNTDEQFIVVYDDGVGMNLEGLTNLWHVGDSPKKIGRISDRFSRRQIGKFGIGKLATYTIAKKLTYITHSNEETLSVSIDYEQLKSSPEGAEHPLQLPVKRIDLAKLAETRTFKRICNYTQISIQKLLSSEQKSWTIALLEDLKPKSKQLKFGRVRWVLQTAMPLTDEFAVYLNGDRVISSKENLDRVVSFDVSDLPVKRLQSLTASSGTAWESKGGVLISPLFPSGITGHAYVTRKSLLGKSEDLARNNGFFVKVRSRLVNQHDAAFGIHAISSLETMNRFRAEINADDLDQYLTATRENIEDTLVKDIFQKVLLEIYREARSRYEAQLEKTTKQDANKSETERNFVNTWMVEYPVADVLSTHSNINIGADADDAWFYLDIDEKSDTTELARKLYKEIEQGNRPQRYKYEYSEFGPNERMVKFDPASGIFRINEAHAFVRAHSDEGRARSLLEDMLTSEALLEVYLRSSSIPASVVGETLERRDELLRSLAQDHPYSLKLLATNLREAKADERDLEFSLVAAARALGFVAKHVSGPGEPDGIARLIRYPNDDQTIVLEAKSSGNVPSLSAIDFAGIAEHVERNRAHGCLLLAPEYPGQTQDDNAAGFRAKQLRISCWRVDDFAQVVELAEARHLTAEDILKIVLNSFDPESVKKAVDELLAAPTWERVSLYRAVISALRQLEGRLKDRQRTVDMVAAEVSRLPDFLSVETEDIYSAVRDISGSSKNALLLKGDIIILNVSIDELERRISGIIHDAGVARRNGNFKANG